MKKFPLIARIVLGSIFSIFGLAGLLQMMPPPANMPIGMETFLKGLMASKYFFPLLKITETVSGLLLLSGFFVPLALVVLAPIVVHIFFVHVFLMPDGLMMALVICVLELYLCFFAKPYSSTVKKLFSAK
jgi:putative oxidoreductase